MNETTDPRRNVFVAGMHRVAGLMDRFGGFYFWIAISYFKMGFEYAHLPLNQQPTLWSAFQNAGPFLVLGMLATLNSLRPRHGKGWSLDRTT